MKKSNYQKGDINYYKKYMKYKNKYITHLHNINQQTKSSNIMIGGCPGCLNPNCNLCYEERHCDNDEPGCIKCKKCQAYSRNFDEEIKHDPGCYNAAVIRMMGGCVGCLNRDCRTCYEETHNSNHELIVICNRCRAHSRNPDQIRHNPDCDNAQARMLAEVWSDHHIQEPERVQAPEMPLDDVKDEKFIEITLRIVVLNTRINEIDAEVNAMNNYMDYLEEKIDKKIDNMQEYEGLMKIRNGIYDLVRSWENDRNELANERGELENILLMPRYDWERQLNQLYNL
jgi:hypothetical protein